MHVQLDRTSHIRTRTRFICRQSTAEMSFVRIIPFQRVYIYNNIQINTQTHVYVPLPSGSHLTAFLPLVNKDTRPGDEETSFTARPEYEFFQAQKTTTSFGKIRDFYGISTPRLAKYRNIPPEDLPGFVWTRG